MPNPCPKCRTENPDGAVYCSKCATRLDGSGAGPGSGPSFTRTLETPPTGLGSGKIFAGRFELIEELGAGGMGVVYRAFDKKVGEEIALKLLHPEIARDERTVERFQNEIKLARKITHKNVCRMHELHEEGQTLFITMEYVTGQDLKGLIRECGALSLGKAVSIAKQVCEGLAHSLLASLRLQRPQPGPGQDEDRGRAGGEIHAPADTRLGSADISGTRGQSWLPIWREGCRAGDDGLSGVYRPSDFSYSRQ